MTASTKTNRKTNRRRCKISHVDAYQCEFTNLAVLDSAVSHLGGRMRQSEKYKWFGSHVGDHPLPKGYTVADMGKCKYAIKFDGIQYEIGVVPSKTKPGTWDLIADWWGPGAKLKDRVAQIKVEYAAQAALLWAAAKGYTNVRISRANGGAQILVEQ